MSRIRKLHGFLTRLTKQLNFENVRLFETGPIDLYGLISRSLNIHIKNMNIIPVCTNHRKRIKE